MPDLNDAQFGLFPADHPAMRERSHAEMSTEQFRTLPGAYHHATYRPSMPVRSTGRDSAGIHLGTVKAAQERVDDMGARNPQLSDIHADPEKPSDIHTRRLAPDIPRAPEGLHPGYADIDKSGPHMRGSHSHPRDDKGTDWGDSGSRVISIDGHAVSGRGTQHYGEFYQNYTEDRGSVSIRVPDDTYLDSHRRAVDRATRRGEPVHPEAAAAHAGGHLDKPVPYAANSQPSTTPYTRYMERARPEQSSSDNRDQGMLLPYKLQATGKTSAHAVEKVPNPYPEEYGSKEPKIVVPAVTFAASMEERNELTSKTYKTVMDEKVHLWESKTSKF